MAEDLFKKPPGESGNVLKVLRGQQRQGLSFARRLLEGQPHIIEEGGDILISLIYLVPEAGEATVIDVTADERGFSAPCKARYPGYRTVPHPVQQVEKSFSRESLS